VAGAVGINVTKPIIPDAALQQHIAVLGKTGSGKTFAAKASIVEPLLERGRRVGIIDPTDAWWGLRSSRDGKGAGFKVLVLGGDHGDLPLPANGGAAVARLLVEQGCNLVASTKHLTVGERTRWFIDFAGTINRLNRSPLHLVIDEAHNFAPQGKVPDPDTGKMLHAANTLASGGRSIGIRLVMITQRPQKLHKDALTSADTLIAMRVLAPHDRDAVKAWVDGCGDPSQGREVLDSLAGMKRGEGWIWYPEGHHLVRASFPEIRTFDSSATPTDGHAIAAPKGAADVDLAEIRKALADAVKEAEANDPRLLREQIAVLRHELAKKRNSDDSGSETPAWRAEYEAAHARDTAAAYERGRAESNEHLMRAGHEISRINSAIAKAHGAIQIATTELGSLQMRLYHQADAPRAEKPAQIIREKFTVPRPNLALGAKGENGGGGGSLPKSERLILRALAQYPNGRSKVQVAVLTGYAVNGGGFANAIGALRSAGRIEGGADRLTITQIGLNALGAFDPLPQGAALLEHWYGQLGKAERKALEALVEVYPRTLSKPQIAARAGYEPNGGGFANALGRLRSLELIRGRGEIQASEDLFDG
jgi:hypothetical protein